MQGLKIKISPAGVIMLIILILTRSLLSLAALLAAFLHELGHIAAARICEVPLRELRLGIFGASLTLDGGLFSYKSELITAAAGPAVNLCAVLALLPVANRLSRFGICFFTASAFLAILNLLPVADLDGGRILTCILSRFFSPRAVYSVVETLSFLVILSLWSLSVYLLLRLGASLSLFVFSLALFLRTFAQRNV